MPTPFTHLEIAQRILRDVTVSESIQNLLHSELGAFLLGSIAADARVNTDIPREITHFYHYTKGISEHPWRVMVEQHPSLMSPRSAAHRVFMAGYIAHLSVDEMWSLHMAAPHFFQSEWADLPFRFYMLHIILIYMDTRDLKKLDRRLVNSLHNTRSDFWLPFMEDDDLHHWKNFIHEQVRPGGKNKTLKILGQRVGKKTKEIYGFLNSPQQMQNGLWDNVPHTLLEEVEAKMYTHALEQMIVYLHDVDWG